MKQLLFSIFLAVFITSTASAAPLWVERQFIPAAGLIDPVFLEHTTESEPVDYQDWEAFLAEYVTIDADGVARLPYGTLPSDTASQLSAFIARLETIDTTSLTKPQQMAYWINLYNAGTVRLILENYPIKSIRKIKKPWDQPVATVNGVSVTLNQIEHGVIRPVFNDARVHYAVNCASVGCPNLANKAYTGESLEEMLDEAARAFINNPRGVIVDKRGDITVSKIFGWYKEDSGNSDQEILDHIRLFASPSLKSALEGVTKIDDYDYDWDLNETK